MKMPRFRTAFAATVVALAAFALTALPTGAMADGPVVVSANSTPDGTHNKVQLWADGPYWAETNLGADEPWHYGFYFWWGDTVGYKCENDFWVASDGSSSGFSFEEANTPTYGRTTPHCKAKGGSRRTASSRRRTTRRM